MEHAESIEESFELIFLMCLGSVEVGLVELTQSFPNVGFEILCGFIGHLQGILKD